MNAGIPERSQEEDGQRASRNTKLKDNPVEKNIHLVYARLCEEKYNSQRKPCEKSGWEDEGKVIIIGEKSNGAIPSVKQASGRMIGMRPAVL